jgi:adenylate cyclase
MTDDLSDADRQRVLAYEAGLAHYRAQDWDAAEAAFGECLAIEPKDQPSQVMLARVEAFRLKPPGAGWDGVWVALSK